MRCLRKAEPMLNPSMAHWQKRAEPLSCGVATGFRAADGRFDEDTDGHRWLVFQQPHDRVYWNPSDNQIATHEGRAFALGEEAIENAATYALDGALIVYETVAQWVLAGGDGIFVLDWSRAFDRLRDAPRIAVDAAILPLYRRHMRPVRMPQLFVKSGPRMAAE